MTTWTWTGPYRVETVGPATRRGVGAAVGPAPREGWGADPVPGEAGVADGLGGLLGVAWAVVRGAVADGDERGVGAATVGPGLVCWPALQARTRAPAPTAEAAAAVQALTS
jgi:hypothetical protein